MRKISIVAACLIALAPIASSAHINLVNVDFKKEFCGNMEYLGNASSKRPHLHCGKSFMAYKKANGDHTNITDIGDCKRTNTVFDDIKANKTAFADYQGIYNALVLYHQSGCPNQ
ncbi:hypothetical protein [Legionella micdadei]|uniref:Uncharacterized protein n=1 Tax=Legionella micdadei TaxID=451 RepID=A0A098GI74_LEGMI|nr:hypothetical protein [Legionella micdadei]ARG96914.1 hypothetical protein B6N58_04095 [Legionella micdadei]ARG99647.1 hypothetical protein B6V88_04010 [Legionella micdadei]KTD26599.1 hypothetical protein Lmic_2693 [Legionella micdadei]NSL17810.1 hypothetical protein [Legionella micdadei]CEG61682.1 conserved exported protein of unknown function [Legionella micdadei]